MGAYRCSSCNLNFPSSDPCSVCGKTVWWASKAHASEWEEVDAAVREAVRDNPWSTSADKVTNWRFERLLLAGYDVASADEIAQNRLIDLHDAIELAAAYGATGAYLMLI